ncbi:unnamed protein product [marine sediment metagenome]|uniref:Uncharacterized protein n=1 Tax=marine sediment metagenome TaxID=412755 RepID=X1VEV5_9ZZZZ
MLARRLQSLFVLLVIIILLGAWLGLSDETLGRIAELFAVYVIIPTITSIVSGMIVEAVGGGFLKSILFVVEIKGFPFSISAFAIAVVVLKFLIFY